MSTVVGMLAILEIWYMPIEFAARLRFMPPTEAQCSTARPPSDAHGTARASAGRGRARAAHADVTTKWRRVSESAKVAPWETKAALLTSAMPTEETTLAAAATAVSLSMKAWRKERWTRRKLESRGRPDSTMRCEAVIEHAT